ncbi:MAG: sporulation transcriptional regulator SpoIIID [Clostridia bacterium]|nr:sporulation transcriptional regulator SpoIIID [Clostridia bacterium]
MYISSGKERCVILATYLVENNSTVRAAAAHFGISKSTVHKDVTQTLKRVNKQLYYKVKELLAVNKQERHLRGGEATRLKYNGAKSNIAISLPTQSIIQNANFV